MIRTINKTFKNFSLYEILDNFQFIATIHGNELGLSRENMLKNNEFWIMLRTKFEVVNQLDSLNVELTTYPKQPGRLDFDRDYIIKTNNEVNIKGVSKWLVANIETRKLVRNPKVVFPNEFIELSNFDNFDKIKYEEEKLVLISNYTVTGEDLDENNHVNNARYAMMIESIFNTENILSFQIEYINEVFIKEEVELYMYKNDFVYIIGKVNNKICFSSKIKEKE